MRFQRTSRWSVGAGVGADCGIWTNSFRRMPRPEAIGCSGIGSAIGSPVCAGAGGAPASAAKAVRTTASRRTIRLRASVNTSMDSPCVGAIPWPLNPHGKRFPNRLCNVR